VLIEKPSDTGSSSIIRLRFKTERSW
jgi:hypothetical protein